MKPNDKSQSLLGVTRAKAKMLEFGVPPQLWVQSRRNPADLFPLTIAILGDVAAHAARGTRPVEWLREAKAELRFAAFFFDAYLNGEEESPDREYLTLLAAAAYYLCDLPGSSHVLTERVAHIAEPGQARGLDCLLLWLLRGRFGAPLTVEGGFNDQVRVVRDRVDTFYSRGLDPMEVTRPLLSLREAVYRAGDARELLLADLLYAVAKRRLEVAARTCLPGYTALDAAKWEASLAKANFPREFWPAQRLLGERGIFRGVSGVAQMPTSAGKTRATEILLRSAFLSGRTTLAVVVAPFRALCHEIRDSLLVAFRGESVRIDEISDVPQDDFSLEDSAEPHVLILTPEKLLYLTRQVDDLAQRIGLLVYDEGHQFDTGIRGVTYELLLTALKQVVPASCQVVLISAVMANADQINTWLNGPAGEVVSGVDLFPNQRSVAFASWLDTLGRLEYIEQAESGSHTFFVPRVLESMKLIRRKREKKDRYFPTRDDEYSIALYLGLKLVPEGAVAIFCGRKSSVTSICETLSDAFLRGVPMSAPVMAADSEKAADEVRRLTALVKRHYGHDGAIPHCAGMGVFTHHGATPAGLRLAVEHAMKESLVRLVICTSTLAQGVNLPIRYLIVTGVYQGAQRISVRDFQNLMGRAGRSGMHTEGSVIFSNPETFDQRNTPNGRWRWNNVAELLDPTQAEQCASSLLDLFAPLTSAAGATANLNVRVFFEQYLAEPGGARTFAKTLARQLEKLGFTLEDLTPQLEHKGQIIAALESFMMAASTLVPNQLDAVAATALARGTLAYHLASEIQRTDLETLFQAIAAHVTAKVPQAARRRAYSKSLFGVWTSLEIHEWARTHAKDLVAAEDDDTLLSVSWPMLAGTMRSNLVRRCTKPGALPEFARRWMNGEAPITLLAFLAEEGVRFGDRYATIDHVVELCENALAFDGVLALSAIIETMRLEGHDGRPVIERLEVLQKRLKYGLRETTAIALHEIGFADRAVATALAQMLGTGLGRNRVLRRLRRRSDAVFEVLEDFPSYYTFVGNNLLRKVGRD